MTQKSSATQIIASMIIAKISKSSLASSGPFLTSVPLTIASYSALYSSV